MDDGDIPSGCLRVCNPKLQFSSSIYPLEMVFFYSYVNFQRLNANRKHWMDYDALNVASTFPRLPTWS